MDSLLPSFFETPKPKNRSVTEQPQNTTGADASADTNEGRSFRDTYSETSDAAAQSDDDRPEDTPRDESVASGAKDASDVESANKNSDESSDESDGAALPFILSGDLKTPTDADANADAEIKTDQTVEETPTDGDGALSGDAFETPTLAIAPASGETPAPEETGTEAAVQARNATGMERNRDAELVSGASNGAKPQQQINGPAQPQTTVDDVSDLADDIIDDADLPLERDAAKASLTNETISKSPAKITAAANTAAQTTAVAANGGADASVVEDGALLDGIAGDGLSTRLTSSASAANSAAAVAATQTPPAVGQVTAAIVSGADGDTIELSLDPPELGKVKINMVTERADAVTAVLTAERSETLDILRRHSDSLARELERAGFASVDLEFRFDQQGEQGSFYGRNEGGDVPSDEDFAPESNVVYLQLRTQSQLDRRV
ncbi:MAG: flagellar hook-length control protein FliK [Pseudomonadota bacterium]